MARSYSRDSNGKFAGGSSKGDRAETIQQNKAKKQAVKRQTKDELSGGKLGGSKRKRVGRGRTVGKRATTKAMARSLNAARKRFA